MRFFNNRAAFQQMRDRHAGSKKINVMVLILDGNSELDAHALSKIGLLGEKIHDL